jgi:polysaccharide biosynthesis/export protein
MSSRVFRHGVIATMSLAITACGAGPMASPGLVSSTPVSSLGQDGYSGQIAQGYQLRPNDIISVQVFREEQLSADQVIISADGNISIPLVGSVRAEGMTPGDLEARIETLLAARYLLDPDVAVNIVDYASHWVTVDGAVEQAGVYNFRPGTRLSGGISLARGPSRVAEMQEVAVFRETPEGLSVAKFDFQAVRAGTMLDPVLQPGDRIVVGTSGLSQFWQDLLRSIPVFALFTRI